MTEEEWLASDSPEAMINSLRDVATERKLRLFAVVCYRDYFWFMLPDSAGFTSFKTWVDLTEQLADGEATRAEWDSSRQYLHGTHIATDPFAHALNAAETAAGVAGWDNSQSFNREQEATQHRRESALVRDIFGNPFRPVAFAPAWRTDTAVAVARQMYDSRDFGAMPILADALQDAGCEDEHILNHCRDTGGGLGEPARGSTIQTAHVRGCWVVDLVLGKT